MKNRSRHLFQSSLIVIVLFGLGKLTGLIRVRLVSNAFGTGPEYDAFTAANQIPEVFVALISGGALAAALIPVYSAYLTHRDTRDRLALANSIITLVLIIMSAISLIGAIFAPLLTSRIMVPGWPAPQQEQAADLMRIILIQSTLFGVGGVLSSILNAHQHFALPALAPITLDIGYFIGIFLLVPSLGIYGLAWGTVAGGLLNIAVQVPGLMRYRFRLSLRIDIHLSGVKEIIKLMIPRVVTIGSVQFVDLIIVRLVHNLEEGSTSGYFYGYQLMQLPETLLGTAVALVAFPTMAELYNAGNIEGLKKTAATTLRIIWMLTIPAAVALIFLGVPAIELLLQGGAFTAESTRLVYSVLVFFSVRVVSEASLEILARLFYARHDTRTPMFVAMVWLLLNILFAYLLVGSLGIRGIALASTIAFTIQSLILFVLNRRQLDGLEERTLLLGMARYLAGAALMAVILFATVTLTDNTILQLIIGGIGGLLVYFAATYILGARELPGLISILRGASATQSN